MSHVMIDIETLGTTPGSVVLSIGAVVFGPEGLGAEFYTTIGIAESMQQGLTISPSTLKWWMGQSQEAQTAAFREEYHIFTALNNLKIWFQAVAGEQVWCHGAAFDVPLLDEAYRSTCAESPWQFWNARCTRTLYELAGVKPDRTQGVHHHALNDAKVQALAAIEAHKKLGIW